MFLNNWLGRFEHNYTKVMAQCERVKHWWRIALSQVTICGARAGLEGIDGAGRATSAPAVCQAVNDALKKSTTF